MPNTNATKNINKTKQSIDNSVKYLIDKCGIEDITIKEICQHAKVSRTNFYYYYKNIDEAILERFKYIDEYFTTVVKPSLILSNTYDNLVLYANHYFKFVLTFNINYTKQIYISQIKYSNSNVHSPERPIYKTLIELFDSTKHLHEDIKNQNSCDLADLFLTIMRGAIFNWLICNGGYNLESRAEKTIKIFLNGLL